jgi:hypothetical protein
VETWWSVYPKVSLISEAAEWSVKMATHLQPTHSGSQDVVRAMGSMSSWASSVNSVSSWIYAAEKQAQTSLHSEHRGYLLGRTEPWPLSITFASCTAQGDTVAPEPQPSHQ